MPKLAIHDPGVDSAAAVRARAFLVFERRRAAYIKLSAVPPVDEAMPTRPPERPAASLSSSWRPIAAEVARQAGIPTDWLRNSDEGRGQPVTAYRQLSMALLCKLTRLSLTNIGRMFGVDHSTVIHARQTLRPVLDASGLDENSSVPAWVEATLPLVMVHVAQIRANNRAHSMAMRRGAGKFTAAPDVSR